MKAKTFDELCRGIDWNRMEKARVTVRNLATTRRSLKYLNEFLELLADSATDVHGINLDIVHPSAVRAKLVSKAKEQKN